MFKDKIRWIDVKATVGFALAWPVAAVLRRKKKNIWLVSERPGEARDNGYWFYRYVKENHPEKPCFYVIKKDSKDRSRIEEYGDTVDFGSFRHYVVYLATHCHISAHVDADSPNSRVSNFLETHGLLKNKRVFLQHGITKDRIAFGYYSVSRADLFVCAAKPEYDFCKSEFGYPDGAVSLLGFARYDGLDKAKTKSQILLMPTWRAWLAHVSPQEFAKSEYCRRYLSLLNDPELHKLLNDNDMDMIFFPHSDMQPYLSAFCSACDRIKIASAEEYDVQTLLNESALLVTDYSSVAFDMAYMDKPLCYYHFDYAEYRKGQHPEGYFSYERDGFGPVVNTDSDLISFVRTAVGAGFAPDDIYRERANSFFTIRDKENCARIYEAVRRL